MTTVTDKRPTLYWGVGLFMLALVMRLVIVCLLRQLGPHAPDSYEQIAWNLVQGNSYSLDGDSPTALRSPAYPVLLAALYSLLGRDWFAAHILTATLSALTVSVIFLTGVRLFSHKIGVISAVIAAFYPGSLYIASVLYSENLFNFLLALGTLMLIKVSMREARTTDKLLAGFCLGLMVLTRSEAILLFPLLVAWVFWMADFKALNTIKLVAPILLPGLILMSGWTIRNYYALHALVPTTTGGGSVLRGVHNDLTFTDVSYMGKWIPSSELPDWEELKKLPEAERDRARYRMALTSINHHLESLPRLEAYKLHNFVFGDSPARAVGRFPIVFFSIIGLTISWRAAKRRCSVIYILLLYYLINALVFYASERLRSGVEPYLFIFAAFGAFEYLQRLAQIEPSSEEKI